MKPSDQIIQSIKSLNKQASPDLDRRIHAGIDQALDRQKKQRSTHPERSIRRHIMKTPITQFATAAIIILAITLCFTLGGSVTFAEVAQYITNYNTIELDFIAGDEATAPVIHDIIKGNRIRRTVSNIENPMIVDIDRKQMLILDSDSHEATLLGIEGMMSDGTHELLEMIRTLVAKVDANPDLVAQKLGRREFDGVEAVGFELEDKVGTFRFWADPVSATPKRIEMSLGETSYILKNIQIDLPVSDDLVSMEAPEGYTMSDQPTTQIGDPTEEDLLVILGFWAEHINGGTFPDQIGVQDMMELLPTLEATITNLELSKQEQGLYGLHYARCMMLIQILDQKGERHYAGKGVTYGDSQTAVMWYRQGDTKTYRVIYGDLHVEEVGLDKLPQ